MIYLDAREEAILKKLTQEYIEELKRNDILPEKFNGAFDFKTFIKDGGLASLYVGGGQKIK